MEASRELSPTPPHLPPCSDVSVLQKTRMSHFWDTHHKKKTRTRREAVAWNRNFVCEVSSELRLSPKKFRHESACFPPEMRRGRDTVHDCNAMDAHAVSPVRLSFWPESNEFRHRQNGVHKNVYCCGQGDLCGLNPSAWVNGMRDFADCELRAHTAVHGPDRIQPPPPSVGHHNGHLRVPASWSYRTKKTGKCKKKHIRAASKGQLTLSCRNCRRSPRQTSHSHPSPPRTPPPAALPQLVLPPPRSSHSPPDSCPPS